MKRKLTVREYKNPLDIFWIGWRWKNVNREDLLFHLNNLEGDWLFQCLRDWKQLTKKDKSNHLSRLTSDQQLTVMKGFADGG